MTLVAASGALTLTLAFLDSDVEQRALDANAINAGLVTGSVGWRAELVRYSAIALSQEGHLVGYGTPLRRASVALIVLVALAAFVLARRKSDPLLRIAIYTLPLALLVFLVTPTKWPWHFGALLAPTALSAAMFVNWVRNERESATSWSARPLVVLGCLTVAIAWSWSPRPPWNPFDLRTLDWTLGVEAWLSLGVLASAAPLVWLSVSSLRARARQTATYREPWSVSIVAVPLLAVPLIAFTAAILIADAARTSGWTGARGNLGALVGRHACGLADDLLVPKTATMRPVPAAPANVRSLTLAPPAPVPGARRYALGRTLSGSSSTPWFGAPRERLGMFVSGLAPRESRPGGVGSCPGWASASTAAGRRTDPEARGGRRDRRVAFRPTRRAAWSATGIDRSENHADER